MTLPPVELLSYSGMGFVGAYAVWELKVAPVLRRRRSVVGPATS